MSDCRVQTTLPGTVKRVINPSFTDSTVCCSDTTCTKTFENNRAFERELAIYLRRLSYVPQLVSYDHTTRTIVTERVGVPLGNLWDSGMTITAAFQMSQRWRQDHRIRRLNKQFHNDTGLHHNDICYKNVLVDKNKIYLIDFETADVQKREMDVDGILSNSKRRNVVVLACMFILIIVFVLSLMLTR